MAGIMLISSGGKRAEPTQEPPFAADPLGEEVIEHLDRRPPRCGGDHK